MAITDRTAREARAVHYHQIDPADTFEDLAAWVDAAIGRPPRPPGEAWLRDNGDGTVTPWMENLGAWYAGFGTGAPDYLVCDETRWREPDYDEPPGIKPVGGSVDIVREYLFSKQYLPDL